MPDRKPTLSERITLTVGCMAAAYGLGSLMALLTVAWVFLWRTIAPEVCP